jgi:hypothetical protein
MSQQFGKDVAMDGVRGSGENLFLGILAGAIAAAIGAAIWMGITMATGVQFGLVALGVGALVGLAVRLVGNGTSMIFGVLGAILTLIGCLGGEILTRIQQESTPQHNFFATLNTVDLPQLLTTIFTQMGPVSYLIYGIGIYEGYKLSIRK